MTGRVARLVLGPILLAAAVAGLFTSCPTYRDGVSGQLASAEEQTESAAHSAALALQLWHQGRSPDRLVAVQISDARDDVAESYDTTAVLRTTDPTDLARQTLLMQVMTEIISTLNRSYASVRAGAQHESTDDLRAALLAAADDLRHRYR
ncbi:MULTISPECIES: hypothetical protein [Mycolicibacterium]|uniref:hypothetical protein n=1 Tax=Mycolicibacterium TaxID=1866885 RepID=UPI001F4CAAD0|nr:hypothetical protein [Mycolicibacterium neoaurum]